MKWGYDLLKVITIVQTLNQALDQVLRTGFKQGNKEYSLFNGRETTNKSEKHDDS